MNVQEHVFDFLTPIAPHSTILRYSKMMLKMAQKKPEIYKTFELVEEQFEGKALIDQKYSFWYEQLSKLSPSINIPGLPEFVAPLVAITYLKAKNNIQKQNSFFKLNSPEQYLQKIEKVLKNLETDFLGELLLEITTRTIDDHHFAEMLKAAGQEISELVSQLNDEQKTFFASRSSSGGRGTSCQACRTNPDGTRVCTPVDSTICTIVIIVIIIVIVTK